MASRPVMFRSPSSRAMNPGQTLIRGQQAENNAMTGILDGIGDLMKTAEDKYRQENTLNLQEHFKKRLMQDGLGAAPIDEVEIKRRFGNMVNMEEVNSAFNDQQNVMKQEAIDNATTGANDLLTESNDPLASRKEFEKRMRASGATESMVTDAVQDFSDKNATRFKDAETLEIRAKDARTDAVFDLIASGDGDTQLAITEATKNMKPRKRAAEIRRLEGVVAEREKRTDEQNRQITHYVNMEKIRGQEQISAAENKLKILKDQHAALQNTGVGDAWMSLAKKSAQKLGESVTGNIMARLDNIIEGFSSKSDGKVIKAMHAKLTADYGINREQADAIIAQTFSQFYPGDSATGNNMNGDQLDGMKIEANKLAAKVGNKNKLTSAITAATQNVSDATNAAAKSVERTRKRLEDAARKKRLRLKDALGVEGAFKSIMANMGAAVATEPQLPKPTNKKGAAEPEEDTTMSDAEYKTLAIAANNVTEDEITAEQFGPEQLKRKLATANAQLAEQAKKVGGPSKFIGGKRVSLQEHDDAVSGMPAEFSRMVRDNTPIGWLGKRIGDMAGWVYGIPERQRQDARGMWGDMRLAQAESRRDDRLTAQDKTKVDSLVNDSSKSTQLAEPIKRSLSKIPASDQSAKELVQRLQSKHAGADLSKVIAALRQANPALAEKVAILLKAS